MMCFLILPILAIMLGLTLWAYEIYQYAQAKERVENLLKCIGEGERGESIDLTNMTYEERMQSLFGDSK